MKRPHLSLSIAELTALAESASSVQTLKQVCVELSHRKTPGAKRLEAIVKTKLEPSGLTKSPRRLAPADAPRGTGRSTSKPTSALRRTAPRKPKNRPTEEQAHCISEFMTGESLKVTAFAGAGKTSTLVQMADQRDGCGLYLAFNKAIADEARSEFPSSVDCRTTHSVALKSVRATDRFSHDKLFTQIGPKQLAAALELKSINLANVITFTDVQQAHLFSKTVRRFCQSADDVLSEKHVTKMGRLIGLTEGVQSETIRWIVGQSSALWQKMIDPSDQMPMGHDGYLKLWSLSDPVLDYDFVMVDEAQDTNPAVLCVLERQRTQLVYVGDQHQQIYAWRGATNAMAEARTERYAYLTQSFRFGPEIADAATSILKTLGETKTIRGNPTVSSQIRDFGQAKAVLTRTNAMTISEVIDALERQEKPHILGGTQDTLELVGAVYDLMAGKPSARPEFFGFTNWDQVIGFSETDEGEELRPFVSLVQKYGHTGLYRALKSTVGEEKDADVTLSTAHKSKGRQWASVRIADDFSGVQTDNGAIPEEETRLFYVAITRAQQALIISNELLSGFKLKRLPPKNRRKPKTGNDCQSHTETSVIAPRSPSPPKAPTSVRTPATLQMPGVTIRVPSSTASGSTPSALPTASSQMTEAPARASIRAPALQKQQRSSVSAPDLNDPTVAGTAFERPAAVKEEAEEEPTPPKKPKKKGFFARLFG